MTSCGLGIYSITAIASHCCGHCTPYAGKHGNFGKVHIQGEEVADNKFDIFLQLAANNLDKKDFFGKVCAKLYAHLQPALSVDPQFDEREVTYLGFSLLSWCL